MYYMWINKNLVHQVGDQTKDIIYCQNNLYIGFLRYNLYIYINYFDNKWSVRLNNSYYLVSNNTSG